MSTTSQRLLIGCETKDADTGHGVNLQRKPNDATAALAAWRVVGFRRGAGGAACCVARQREARGRCSTTLTMAQGSDQGAAKVDGVRRPVGTHMGPPPLHLVAALGSVGRLVACFANHHPELRGEVGIACCLTSADDGILAAIRQPARAIPLCASMQAWPNTGISLNYFFDGIVQAPAR